MHCCDLCMAKNGLTQLLHAPLQPFSGAMMESAAVDILGPFLTTKVRKSYILVIVDYFTKWLEGNAIPKHSMIMTVGLLVEAFFCWFSVLEELDSICNAILSQQSRQSSRTTWASKRSGPCFSNLRVTVLLLTNTSTTRTNICPWSYWHVVSLLCSSRLGSLRLSLYSALSAGHPRSWSSGLHRPGLMLNRTEDIPRSLLRVAHDK